MANTKYTISLIDRVTKTATKIGASLNTVGVAAKRASASINSMGLLMGGTVLFAGINKSIKAWDEQEQSIAQVRAGLESTKMASGKTLTELTKQARDLQKDTLFGDEAILKGVTSQLLTFTNIAGNAFDRTQKAALDVTTKLYGAKAGSESLRATAIQLGKALNDPVSNLGALSRSGIQFSKTQKKLIKDLWSTGREAEAQSIILSEIEAQYGGAAAAAAEAGAGGLTQLKNRFSDIVEVIGGTLFPVIERVSVKIAKLATWIENNNEKFKNIVKTIGTFVTVMGSAVIAIKLVSAAMAVNPIGLIVVAIGVLITAVIRAWDKFEGFRKVVLGTWEAIKELTPMVREFATSLKENLINRIKQIFEGIKGLSGAIKAFFKGQFKEAGELAKKGIDDIYNISGKKEKAEKAGKRIADAYRKGAAKGIRADAISIQSLNMGGDPGGLDDIIDLLSPDATKLKAEGIVSGGISTYNINIQQVTGVDKLETTNIEEAPEKVGDAIIVAITEALADIKKI